ncbi:bifunctional purine biosynthesis protein PurH [Clostridia bacterium]|nr:bifunctional purine biosynthesis protein PurH [Clostridia bacterium]
MKRALISVSDKTGIVDFAKELLRLGIEIISTGGTKRVLQEAGLSIQSVEDITGFPEILDGRVKTLHPRIHAGILAEREIPKHQETLRQYEIEPIDLVCVNLYPFQEIIEQKEALFEQAIENIDIGGPSMLRSAAKNYTAVTAVIDPIDYEFVLNELRAKGDTCLETKKKLSAKVFRYTAQYDALIAQYLTENIGEQFPEKITLSYNKQQSLRYGENPHQEAAFYREPILRANTISVAKQLHGKALSYNNLRDADAAFKLVGEFTEPTAVVVKHMNPCGVGCGKTIQEAYVKAYEADKTSIFGGIIALNREVDKETAELMNKIFLEIVLAPAFSEEAFAILCTKKNIRLLTLPFGENRPSLENVSVGGGILFQAQDRQEENEDFFEVITERKPTKEEWKALLMQWKVVKHVKSNAIVVGNAQQTFGVGAGQMNRIGAAEIALSQAGEKAKGTVLASDAFFPQNDTVEAAAKAGISAIIQPGGSIKDQDSIDMANRYQIAMVMTHVRHFKH